ncbi:hypothetical protein NKH23_30655 [Mesorhizobium sp. M1328]
MIYVQFANITGVDAHPLGAEKIRLFLSESTPDALDRPVSSHYENGFVGAISAFKVIKKTADRFQIASPSRFPVLRHGPDAALIPVIEFIGAKTPDYLLVRESVPTAVINFIQSRIFNRCVPDAAGGQSDIRIRTGSFGRPAECCDRDAAGNSESLSELPRLTLTFGNKRRIGFASNPYSRFTGGKGVPVSRKHDSHIQPSQWSLGLFPINSFGEGSVVNICNGMLIIYEGRSSLV